MERLGAAIRSGQLALLSSDALAFEVRRAPARVQRFFRAVLELATALVPGPTILSPAQCLAQEGLG